VVDEVDMEEDVAVVEEVVAVAVEEEEEVGTVEEEVVTEEEEAVVDGNSFFCCLENTLDKRRLQLILSELVTKKRMHNYILQDCSSAHWGSQASQFSQEFSPCSSK